jgi:hypothetical protein
MASTDNAPTFWAADGALRAYANRMAVIACILALVVMGLGIAVIATRVKPPTVIRIAANGEAVVVTPDGQKPNNTGAQNGNAGIAPTGLEKEHFVVTFVNQYMGYDEHTLAENWAQAMSMMTSNLKQDTLVKMQQENTVGQLQEDHTRSVVKISSAQSDGADPMVWHIFATRTVSHVTERREISQKLAEAYTVRLIEGIRSVATPSGLMVGEFHVQQVSSENAVPTSNP